MEYQNYDVQPKEISPKWQRFWFIVKVTAEVIVGIGLLIIASHYVF